MLRPTTKMTAAAAITKPLIQSLWVGTNQPVYIFPKVKSLLGSEEALVVFPAIREVYQSQSVTSLPEPSSNVIVFHNHAVKFLTTNRTADKEKNKTLDKVAEMIRQFSKDGVKMKICIYAVKVFGIDPETILPEIEKVPNGFISISGYQANGYSLIAIP